MQTTSSPTADTTPRIFGRFELRPGERVLLADGAPVPLGARAFDATDRSQGFLAWDYGHDLALSLPRGALYFGEGDLHVFPLL